MLCLALPVKIVVDRFLVLPCPALLCSLVALGTLVSPGYAQTTTLHDASLGILERSVVINQGAAEIVTGGAVRGDRLFHSFEQLHVGAGRSLYFANPAGINQIFSRVTGNFPSMLDGTLGVLGDADLFVLNPNGLLFGPNAELDLSGSFMASTANGFQLGSVEFNAVVPQTLPRLTLSTPLGLNNAGATVEMNWGERPGSIVNRSVANGTGLSVEAGRSLSLLGGDITLDGGIISAVDGRIALQSQGDLTLQNQAGVGVSNLVGDPNSEIHVMGQTISLDGASSLISGNFSSIAGASILVEAQTLMVGDGSDITTVAQGPGRGGNIIATVPGQVTLTNAARDRSIGNPSFIQTITLGDARGGEIDIKTGDFLTEYNGYVTTQTGAFSTGDGGDLTVEASRSVQGRYSSPDNGFGGGFQVGTRGSGTGGRLRVKTPQLNFQDHHNLLSVSWLSGQGGAIQVEADQIQLSDEALRPAPLESGIRAVLFGSGDGGDINVSTQSLSLQAGAIVITFVDAARDESARLASALDPSLLALLGSPNTSTGNAGDINIVADTIKIDGFNPVNPVVPSQISSITIGVGNAGDVNLTSRELKLLNGGGTGSSSLFGFSSQGIPLDSGQGNGGNLTVNADEITVTGSNPITELSSLIGTQAGGLGDAGNTTINARRLRVLDGGLINSGTLTSGNGGALTIQAQESITVDGVNANGQVSTIGTFALRPSEALREAFSLPEIPRGETQALQLSSDRLAVTNGGQISAEHQGIGNASNIDIQAGHVLLDQGRIISETATGRGGDLSLTIKNELQLRNQSQITATARGGTGDSGNVMVRANAVVAVPDENSDIVANAQSGRGGNITLKVNGLFGIQFQEQLTDESDITASSRVEGLDGSVEIDLLAQEPSLGLAALPDQLLNPSYQISDSCRPTAASHFIVSGRGGLPTDPRQRLLGQQSLEDWRTTIVNTMPQPLISPNLLFKSPISFAPIEAQDWRVTADNKIQLVAEVTYPMRDNTATPVCSNLTKQH